MRHIQNKYHKFSMIQWNIGLLKNAHNAVTNQVVKQILTIHIGYQFLNFNILYFVIVATLYMKTMCLWMKVNHVKSVVIFLMDIYIILLILLILRVVSLVQYVDILVVHQELVTLVVAVIHGILLGYVQIAAVIVWKAGKYLNKKSSTFVEVLFYSIT